MRRCFFLSVLISLSIARTSAAGLAANDQGCQVHVTAQAGDTARWAGPCQAGLADGRGTLELSRAGRAYLTYTGDMKAGRYHGSGIMETRGNRYQGQWAEGRKQGKGKMDYATGGSYDGHWHHNRFHGTGTITYAGGRGATYEFVDGSWPDQIIGPENPGTGSGTPFSSDSNVPGIQQSNPRGVAIPLNLGYHKLNKAQKTMIALRYVLMDPRDEPPYYEDGPAHAYRELQESGLEIASVRTLVTVGPDGKAQRVTTLGSPSRETTETLEYIFKNERYKPGKCDGKPCTMILSLDIGFTGRGN